MNSRTSYQMRETPSRATNFGREVIGGVDILPPAARKAVGARGFTGKVMAGSGIELDIAGEDVEEGGLAGAVFPAQEGDFALGEFGIQGIE